MHGETRLAGTFNNLMLERLAGGAQRLRGDLRLPWPAEAEHAVACVAIGREVPTRLPAVVALLGGASSGKSTIFDNLLGGRLTSRITARGHATLGPILAVHESRYLELARTLESDRFLPGFDTDLIELDDNVTGQASRLAVVRHAVDELRDALLFDLPDFTSGAAADEGDVALSLMPWFDRIVVVLDHERWFDRQSVSTLRERSVRFGQERWVVFNQTQDAVLSESQRHALTDQAAAISASGLTFLEFRRGRGLSRFPPNTFGELLAFAASDPPDRSSTLLRYACQASGTLLNQNEERAARLGELRQAIEALRTRTIPDHHECMTALMTAEERNKTEWLARVFRVSETRRWLSGQSRRLTAAVRQIPVVGSLLAPGTTKQQDASSEETDRRALGRRFAERVAEHHHHELRRLVRSSRFWNELRGWTGLEPSLAYTDSNSDVGPWLDECIAELDRAIRGWNERVAAECDGLSPHLHGAVGAGTIALAVALIAVPGPVTALTAIAAKGAVAAALTQILAATGVGAMAGRPVARLASVVREKLIGSAEFTAVRKATSELRLRLEAICTRISEKALSEASAYVLPDDDELAFALQHLRDAGDRE